MLKSTPVSSLKGTVIAPGDKSCSHRALILGGLAEGRSQITGLLEGDDVLRTGKAMAELGASLENLGSGRWRIEGVGARGLSTPNAPLDFGNSGTGSRLMMGLMASYDIRVELVGDQSLSSRPMKRIIQPISEMGAIFEASAGATLPLTLQGTSDLQAIEYAPP